MNHKLIGAVALLAMFAFTFGTAVVASGVLQDLEQVKIARKNAAVAEQLRKKEAEEK